ncbi:uncharacterized protein LOC127875905 [Dreissena polymorpha]|uniref:uncharacterized protein LOC127875905 n=1 Tax=Dreissena polymorpha TaxID=45954 RepID=UPI002263BFDA|nr:uncharacterized protein LOC127875905 [Dreissena polymorpha]
MRLFALFLCAQYLVSCNAWTTERSVWGNRLPPVWSDPLQPPASPSLTDLLAMQPVSTPNPLAATTRGQLTTAKPKLDTSTAAAVFSTNAATTPAPKATPDFNARWQSLIKQTVDIASHPKVDIANLTASLVSALLLQSVTTTEAPVATTTVAPTTSSKPGLDPKPILQMTLGEILLAASRDKVVNGDTNPSTKPKTTESPVEKRGCFFDNKWYQPLSEIERGQTGSWCYGSYCNHESMVIHWDDHNCTISTTAPTRSNTGSDVHLFNQLVNIAKPLTPSPKSPASLNADLDPATMNQFYNQFVALGAPITGDVGMLMPGSQSSGGGSNLASLAALDPSLLSKLQETMGPNLGGVGSGAIGGPALGGSSGPGCFHEGRLYSPGADITNNREYGHCYGTYCDFNSKVVHWSDRCAQTMAPPTQSYQDLHRQLQQLDLLKK